MKALLVIDMQEKYMSNYDEGLIDRVNERIIEAKQNSIPVIYIKNIGITGNTNGYDLSKRLNVISNIIFTKRMSNAFTSRAFVEYIEKNKFRSFDIVGVDGRCCVAKTAMAAVKREFKVRLLLDSVGARSDLFYKKDLDKLQKVGIEVL